MHANMNVSEQCGITASKGNQVIGMIRRNIAHKENGVSVPLYKTIVKPRLNNVHAWIPFHRKDIENTRMMERDLRCTNCKSDCERTTVLATITYNI